MKLNVWKYKKKNKYCFKWPIMSFITQGEIKNIFIYTNLIKNQNKIIM